MLEDRLGLAIVMARGQDWSLIIKRCKHTKCIHGAIYSRQYDVYSITCDIVHVQPTSIPRMLHWVCACNHDPEYTLYRADKEAMHHAHAATSVCRQHCTHVRGGVIMIISLIAKGMLKSIPLKMKVGNLKLHSSCTCAIISLRLELHSPHLSVLRVAAPIPVYTAPYACFCCTVVYMYV